MNSEKDAYNIAEDEDDEGDLVIREDDEEDFEEKSNEKENEGDDRLLNCRKEDETRDKIASSKLNEETAEKDLDDDSIKNRFSFSENFSESLSAFHKNNMNVQKSKFSFFFPLSCHQSSGLDTRLVVGFIY